MRCPMFKGSCFEENCAWWYKLTNECAALLLARTSREGLDDSIQFGERSLEQQNESNAKLAESVAVQQAMVLKRHEESNQ